MLHNLCTPLHRARALYPTGMTGLAHGGQPPVLAKREAEPACLLIEDRADLIDGEEAQAWCWVAADPAGRGGSRLASLAERTPAPQPKCTGREFPSESEGRGGKSSELREARRPVLPPFADFFRRV